MQHVWRPEALILEQFLCWQKNKKNVTLKIKRKFFPTPKLALGSSCSQEPESFGELDKVQDKSPGWNFTYYFVGQTNAHENENFLDRNDWFL